MQRSAGQFDGRRPAEIVGEVLRQRQRTGCVPASQNAHEASPAEKAQPAKSAELRQRDRERSLAALHLAGRIERARYDRGTEGIRPLVSRLSNLLIIRLPRRFSGKQRNSLFPLSA